MTRRLNVRYYVHMNKSTTLPISEARKKIFSIARDVQKPNQHYTLTENGRPRAIILSVDEYQSLIETVDVLNSPSLLKDIKKAESEYTKGQYSTLDNILKEEGYVQVSSHSREISRKKTKKTP